MKIDMVLSGPKGKMWDLSMNYYDLPAEYAMEIASTARALVNLIANTAGNATGSDKAYEIKFSFGGFATPKDKPLPPEYEDLFKGAATTDDLLYSQAVEIQDAGIALLQKLQDSAHMEIKSGQRS